MAAPEVTFWDRDTNTDISSVGWHIGQVDAGTVSAEKGVIIWNNKAGAEDVSDMQDVTITTKDSKGGTEGELVGFEWIEVRVDDGLDVNFHAIGVDHAHPIKAPGSTTNADGTFTPGVDPHSSESGAVNILGVKNDGSVDAKGNYVETTLRANVPQLATAGVSNFLVRVSYKYV